MQKVLFCNIGWMNHYNGIDGDSIDRGGSYNDSKIGWEACNFTPVGDDIFGYVEMPGEKLNIPRIGANSKDESISNILVIWLATRPQGGTVIIGWYKEATVYKFYRDFSKTPPLHQKNNVTAYLIKALEKNAFLLPVDKRIVKIPRAVKGGIGQSNIWYADKPESKPHVMRALQLINSIDDEEIINSSDDIATNEGKTSLVEHIKRERNPKLVKEKKAQFLNENGNLNCEVCEFDFEKKYGTIGKEVCEVHHLKQLSKSNGEVKTEMRDLAILCSNCHNIIHRKNPMLTIQELKKVMKNTFS